MVEIRDKVKVSFRVSVKVGIMVEVRVNVSVSLATIRQLLTPTLSSTATLIL